MKLSELLSYARRAVDDYSMIEDGDRIAVGLSGGKDSTALLTALAHLKRFYPKKFELGAITVSLGFDGMDFSPIKAVCESLSVPYCIVDTNIADIIFNIRKEKNPCALCSKMRKGALNDRAVSLGFNKVALGHNEDDVIETFFLSLLYEGRLNTFSPVTYLDRKDITLIRPLIYAPEKEIKTFIALKALPIVINACIVDGYTKRERVKELIQGLDAEFLNLHGKVAGAIKRSGLKGW